MFTRASNIAEQGSDTLDSSYTCTSTSQTSGTEQAQLSSYRIQAYVNNTDHSSTHASPTQAHINNTDRSTSHATQAYTIGQASVTRHYTSAATNNIENFDASFHGKACYGRGR